MPPGSKRDQKGPKGPNKGQDLPKKAQKGPNGPKKGQKGLKGGTKGQNLPKILSIIARKLARKAKISTLGGTIMRVAGPCGSILV